MADRVVTARGDRMTSPYIVATDPAQRSALAELGLSDPGLPGPAAGVHFNTNFYVWDRPAGMGNGVPSTRLQVGYFAGFGGAVFFDEAQPDGADWAWIALPRQPMEDPPRVYFNQEDGVVFPRHAVMPLCELRDLVLDWANSGQRPTRVGWLVVNDYRWNIDSAGDLAVSADMT
jgi:hypothetical protein